MMPTPLLTLFAANIHICSIMELEHEMSTRGVFAAAPSHEEGTASPPYEDDTLLPSREDTILQTRDVTPLGDEEEWDAIPLSSVGTKPFVTSPRFCGRGIVPARILICRCLKVQAGSRRVSSKS